MINKIIRVINMISEHSNYYIYITVTLLISSNINLLLLVSKYSKRKFYGILAHPIHLFFKRNMFRSKYG